MNRVIKFRAWNPRISKMSQNTITIETLAEAGCKVQADGLVWLQFTGLTDCNGVEIYEGDVIKLDCVLYSVEWNVNGHWHYRRAADRSVFGTSLAIWESEVIGNIYEHPHLLDRPSEQP